MQLVNQRRHLLQTATVEQFRVLYEITFNILQGNISLSDEDARFLWNKTLNTLIQVYCVYWFVSFFSYF